MGCLGGVPVHNGQAEERGNKQGFVGLWGFKIEFFVGARGGLLC